MAPTKTEVRWLHLSDLHLKPSQQWSQDIVLNSLATDIATRYGSSRRPDLLFITGDVAFSGQVEEYVAAEKFIHKLLEITSLPADRLFIVPGNHDIDRSIEEDAFSGARLRLENQIEVDKFFANENRRRTLFRRQAAFREFLRRIGALSHEVCTPVSFAHGKHTSVGPITVRVLLLDSAWLSQGGESDMAGLLIGEPQILNNSVLSCCPGLTLGLVHHPLNWLKEFEQLPVENLLINKVHALFRGHIHSHDIREIGALGERLTVFTAGASYETRTSHNFYGWGCIDLLTGLGQSISHAYLHSSKTWQAGMPQSWVLSNKGRKPISMAQALDHCKRVGGKFIHFKSCLISAICSDVPSTVKDEFAFISLESQISDADFEAATVVKKLRHLFQWQEIWKAEDWEIHTENLIRDFDAILHRFHASSPARASALDQKEIQCMGLTRALLPPIEGGSSPSVQNIREIGKAGDWPLVLSMIDHWRSDGNYGQQEQRELNRLEIIALMQLGRLSEATSKATVLIADGRGEASDYHLAATCSYNAKNYKEAAGLLHRALDLKIPVDQAKRLALSIAGHTGDANLVKRVQAS